MMVLGKQEVCAEARGRVVRCGRWRGLSLAVIGGLLAPFSSPVSRARTIWRRRRPEGRFESASLPRGSLRRETFGLPQVSAARARGPANPRFSAVGSVWIFPGISRQKRAVSMGYGRPGGQFLFRRPLPESIRRKGRRPWTRRSPATTSSPGQKSLARGIMRYKTHHRPNVPRPDSARTKGRGQGRLQGAQPHDRSRHARLSKARLKPPGGPRLPPQSQVVRQRRRGWLTLKSPESASTTRVQAKSVA